MQHFKADPLGLVAQFGHEIEITLQHQSIHLGGLEILIYSTSFTKFHILTVSFLK